MQLDRRVLIFMLYNSVASGGDYVDSRLFEALADGGGFRSLPCLNPATWKFPVTS
jgi:hypothetical protein